jgi:surfeit locus 1 family protein
MPEIALGRYRFRPGLKATALTMLFVALTIGLGRWQSGRAEQKLALQQQVDAMAAAPAEPMPAAKVEGPAWVAHHLAARGRYQGAAFLLDNRVYRGTPGYHVLGAFCPDNGGTCVVVNRGWIAAGPRHDHPPQAGVPQGPGTVEGIAVLPTAQPYELGSDEGPGPVIEHLVLDRLAARTGLALQPFVLQQTSAAADGLIRDWPRPDTGVDMHRAYALQWYAMAAVAVALWVGLNTRRPRNEAETVEEAQ